MLTVRTAVSAARLRSGAASYHVRAGTLPGGANAFNANVGSVTTITAVNVGNGSYFVRVFAVNATGESIASNEVRVDVGSVVGPCLAPPLPPSNLTFSVAARVVTLAWTASTATSFHIVEAGSSPAWPIWPISTAAALPVACTRRHHQGRISYGCAPRTVAASVHRRIT